jgi:hypothetical protein
MNFYTSCPEVKRAEQTFFEYVSVGGVKTKIEFKKEVIWFAMSESQIFYVHGGEILKESTGFTDYYGLYSSTKSAIDEIKDLAKIYDVDQNSTLEIRAISTLKLTPAIETEETKKENKDRDPKKCRMCYREIPESWYVDQVQEDDWVRNLELEPELIANTIIYNTANGDIVNELNLNEFKNKLKLNRS